MVHSERMIKEKMTNTFAVWQCDIACHDSGPAKPELVGHDKMEATRNMHMLIAQLKTLAYWNLQYVKQQNAYRCLSPRGNTGCCNTC